jgi:hypothetical protein
VSECACGYVSECVCFFLSSLKGWDAMVVTSVVKFQRLLTLIFRLSVLSKYLYTNLCYF